MSEDYLEKNLDDIRTLSEEFAKAKAERVYLEHFRKSKKAILMRKAEGVGHKTVAAQEREAYLNDEYLELLEALKLAVESEEKLWWDLKMHEWAFQEWRTKTASERAERNKYGA